MIDSVCEAGSTFASLVELLQVRASDHPDRVAYSFLGDGDQPIEIRYSELDVQARMIASHIREVVEPEERALLLYPPGLEFIASFFGCAYAGVLAVPACYPKPRRPMPRLTAIANDAHAKVVLTTAKSLETLDVARSQPELEGLEWLSTDTLSGSASPNWEPEARSSDDLLFLQYTSGSTSDPKGVMVSHGNLIHNLELIRQGFGIDLFESENEKGVFWLPAYHDMGLIGGILTSMYVGGQSVLMSPTEFLRRPIRWLEAISEHRAKVSGAPNFAYDLCVQKTTPQQRAGLDLSSWRIGFCGAEPIRPETLERFMAAFSDSGFRPDALYPCYGLAEATLMAAGSQGPSQPVIRRFLRSELAANRVVVANGEPHTEVQRLVACGNSLLDQQVVIANPETLKRCDEGEIGEIWIKGSSVARGYWNRPDESRQTFHATLSESGEGPYLRTGDLGFLHEGNLYVTGRIKDVIIIRGRNLYPQDIEKSVAEAHPGALSGAGAAFSIEVGGAERLGIVQELDRSFRGEDLGDIIRQIRRAVTEEHEVDPHAIVLIRQASLPLTTSGKVQRALCRQQYLSDDLRTLNKWVNANGNANGNGNGDGNGDGNGHSARPVVTHSGNEDSGKEDSGQSGANSNGGGNGHSRSLKIEEGSRLSDSSDAEPGAEQPMTSDQIDRLAERIEGWLMDWVVDRAGVPAGDLDREKPFADYGMDSLTAVELSQDIEDWLGVRVTQTVAWDYPTAATMAGYVAREVAGVHGESSQESDSNGYDPVAHFEQLLAEIEGMNDSQVFNLLSRHGRDVS